MLNKNQSNKRNYWKYATVLPLLGAFVFFFQVKVVAQEKVGTKSEVSKKDDLLGIIIENSNKDELLNYFSKFIKNKKGIEIKFESIKRNNYNKIIAITINSDNNYGQKITRKTANDSPIKAIEISFKKNKEGHNYVIFHEVNVDDIKKSPKGYTVTSISEDKKTPVIEKDLNYWTFDNYSDEGKECLIVINGQKQSKKNKIKIPLDEEILSEKKLNPQESIQKYGEDAENGAVEIITKENVDLLKNNSPTEKKESEQDKGEIENSGNETVSSYKQYLERYKTLFQARFSLERMKVKNEQAKLHLEKARIALKAKLFS